MNRRKLVHLAFAALLLGAMPSVPEVAHAAPPAAQAKGKVDLQVHVIHATEAHSNVDPRLEQLQRYLRHLRYTGYELLETKKVPLTGRGGQTFSIAGDRKVSVELLSKDAEKARLRVKIIGRKGQKLLDTTLSVPRNGTFIVAGPKYKGGILVLPLTARY
jgi:hypothetical protein